MFKKILFMTKPLRYKFDNFWYHKNKAGAQIQPLKDIYKDQPMIVVGNGPSLNKTPLDQFKNIPAIGMNKIDLIFGRVDWKPTLILCANNLVIMQHWKQLLENEIPAYLSWKSRWFIPGKKQKAFKFFNSLDTTEFSKDLPTGVGSAGTVTYTALQFAYYMGANPVILFGVDHSFSFKGNPNEIAKRKGPDENHFDPNYFKSGSKWGLPNLELSEIAYQKVKDVFNRDGRIVYDATIGGKLDIFPKISVSEAKRLCGR